MSIKTTPADKWFSKCVRVRSNWVCDGCGIDLEHDRGLLDCSHFITRAHLSVRYHPLNALAHCKKCHHEYGGGKWGGGNVASYSYHYEKIYGAANRELMRLLAQYPFNYHKHYLPDLAAHYRGEFKRIDEMRKDGVRGRVEFDFFSGSLELMGIIRQIEAEISQEFNCNVNLKVSKNTGFIQQKG